MTRLGRALDLGAGCVVLVHWFGVAAGVACILFGCWLAWVIRSDVGDC